MYYSQFTVHGRGGGEGEHKYGMWTRKYTFFCTAEQYLGCGVWILFECIIVGV